METGQLEVGDLAPRIKELKAHIDDLEGKRNDLVESVSDTGVELLDSSVIKVYVDDLKSLLGKGSIVEQKSFLHSFVKRIEVKEPQVVIDYTIPLQTKKIEPLTQEVLPFTQSGTLG